MVRIVSIFFLRTKIENVADQKWSADRTLGNTALRHKYYLLDSIFIHLNRDWF